MSRIAEFDLWRAGYGGNVVNIYLAGTTTPASVFSDSAMLVPAANPQTLLTLTINNVIYGKFAVPLYTAAAYELSITSGDQTGVIEVPITTLVGQDVSKSKVTPLGGARLQDLDSLLGRVFYVEDTDAIGVSASTNNATITTALGRAAAVGGGEVVLPDNPTILFTQLTIPDGVVLRGGGRAGSPTVLQSQVAGACITLGTGSGLKDVVVDGVNQVVGGIGVTATNKHETALHNVLVKRFETGLKLVGGQRNDWRSLFIDTCAYGARLWGSAAVCSNNRWVGGAVTNTTIAGIELSYEDSVVHSNAIHDVGVYDNTGTGIIANGARDTTLDGCWFTGNTKNWDIHDDTLTGVTDNTVVGFVMRNGSVNGGTATYDDTCANVLFDRVDLKGVAVTLGAVPNNILWKDCTEDAAVTISSTSLGIHVLRQVSANGDAPTSTVVSSDATPLKSWELSLLPGQKAWLEAHVIGSQRNGVGHAEYHIGQAVNRPGSTLLYKTQTANFTLGAVLTGTTSGATGRIIADADGGATGTLTLKDIIGVFLDNEEISDSSGGLAIANGVLNHQNAALLGAIAAICPAVETDAAWAAIFAVNAGNVEVDVTGAAATSIVWTTSVKVSVN
jgi:hypothetical protein